MKKLIPEQEEVFEGTISYDFSEADASVLDKVIKIIDKINFDNFEALKAQIAQVCEREGYTSKIRYTLQTDSDIFQLRGDNFERHIGLEAKIRGKILPETVNSYGERIKVLDVYAIQSVKRNPPTDEELRPYTEGPFLGRLLRPDVFGEEPDLYGEMTEEQMQKLLHPDEDD